MSASDWTRWAADLDAAQLDAVLNRLVTAAKPRAPWDRHPKPERHQSQFTLEMRGNFTKEQRERMKRLMPMLARMAKRSINAWGDGDVKAEFVAFSDDFFEGHAELTNRR